MGDEGAVGGEQLLDAGVEVVAVEAVEVRVVRVGEVRDDHVEALARRTQAFHFDEGVAFDYLHAGVVEGVAVEGRQRA